MTVSLILSQIRRHGVIVVDHHTITYVDLIMKKASLSSSVGPKSVVWARLRSDQHHAYIM